MTDNAVELAEEAVALRLIADALYTRSRDLSGRAAAAMGRGTLFPTMADGTEVAQFTVTADAFTVTVDELQLLPWVRQHYPTEIAETVRQSFITAIRAACKQHEDVRGPGGEADIPGVWVSREPKAPTIKGSPEGKARAAAAVESVLSEVLSSFAGPKLIEGETK
jgi:hypothetical protein